MRLWVCELYHDYEGGHKRYFTTEGKAYKALMGSLTSEYADYEDDEVDIHMGRSPRDTFYLDRLADGAAIYSVVAEA